MTGSHGLDLFGPARLAFNYFLGHVDRRTGRPFMWTYLLTDPPKLAHDAWDTVEELGRYLEALVPLRVMTASDEGRDLELALRDKLVAQQKEDGLIYRPQTSYSAHVADVYDQGSAMLGLAACCLAADDPVCAEAIDRDVATLSELARWDGDDYARFDHVAVQDGRPLARYDGQVLETDNPEAPDAVWLGRLIRPLFQYARTSGREEPLALARALSRDIALRSGGYGEDGSFSRAREGEDAVWTVGHFHSRTNTVAGILRLARHTGDDDLLEWGERVFRWALAHGTRFGWYPEFIGRRDIETEGCETCGVVDMLDAAIALAKSGRDDCWEIADRIWRNQVLENQLRDISWVRSTRTLPDTETESFDGVPERARGGFAGWSGPNDLISDFRDPYFSALDPTQDHRRSLMGCCASSGAKGLYLAWHEALTSTEGGVSVNLPVSRDSDKATVRCREPNEGRLEITMKHPGNLTVRVPGGPDRADVTVERDGTPVDVSWRGDFVELAGLDAGARVVVRYPLEEHTETVTVGGRDFTTPVDYRVTWRGNTVIAVDPPGRHCPLYRRETDARNAPAAEPPVGPVPPNEFDY